MKTCILCCPRYLPFLFSTVLKYHISFWLSCLLSCITFFTMSFGAHLLARNSLHFFFIWKYFYFAFIHKGPYAGYKVLFFHYFKGVLLSSGFHIFWWEIHTHLNYYFLMYNLLLLSRYFFYHLCLSVALFSYSFEFLNL